MSEGEAVASQQKQQHQYHQQQQLPGAMTSMAWQYPPPTHPGLYTPYTSHIYGQGYGSQNQMFYYNQGMMPGYGQAFNAQQVQQQQQQQTVVAAAAAAAAAATATAQNNQAKQQTQQPPVPGTPVSLDDESDLPPLPPGPPPPSQSTQQQNSHNPQLQQPPPFVYTSFPYNGWNGMQNDHSQFNGQIRFNLQNKKTGLGFSPSGNSGAAKKKRKRNKNLAAQFNNSFAGNNAGSGAATSFIPGANLESDLPPLPPPTQHQPPAPPLPSDNPTPEIPQTSSSAINSSAINVQNIPSQTVGPSPPAMTNQSPVGDWPDSLKNYVNRCYEKCKTAVDKDQVEIILKGKITRSANDGSLWVKDWDKEPLPSIHSERMTMTIKPQNQSLKLANPLASQGQGGQRKTGLSTSLGARLGARLSAGSHRRSKSRSRSRSPPSRKYRRSTSSSSNTSERDHEHKSSSSLSKSKKSSRNKQSHNNNNGAGGSGNKKMKKAKQNKSHFYSEFGLATGNGDELGSKEKLQQRAARFSDSISRNNSGINIKDDVATEFDFTGLHIVGTSKDLEKPYLRLTSAPAPSAVRPVNVLRCSLAHVKKRWVAEQDYRYACDQLKSIRQDLTVQGIRDSFTVHVYETHARVALERGDHEEFNQCQTQLRMLYQDLDGENRSEFVAYRILYYIFTKNTQDLTTILASLTPSDKDDECIRHALKVRSAWWLGNFHVFFKLYRKTPRMAAFLMDWFIARERKSALKHMIKSYVFTFYIIY